MAGNFTLSDCCVRPHAQPCWDCKKACGGCSWSRSFQPVPGWEAEKRTIYHGGVPGKQPIESYRIFSCPEYEQEAPRAETCY